MLLNGGCGYENFRLLAPVPLDGRLRPLFDMLDQTARVEADDQWPPYNIEKTGEDQYRITMAVAGFSPEEIELDPARDHPARPGHKHPEPEGEQILHRGIDPRLQADLQPGGPRKVKGASLENGLLTSSCARGPRGAKAAPDRDRRAAVEPVGQDQVQADRPGQGGVTERRPGSPPPGEGTCQSKRRKNQWL